MNRRDFLSARQAGPASLDVSCERLFMCYLDAVNDGSQQEFLNRTLKEFKQAREVRLKESYWLKKNELDSALKPILTAYQSQGGAIEYD